MTTVPGVLLSTARMLANPMPAIASISPRASACMHSFDVSIRFIETLILCCRNIPRSSATRAGRLDEYGTHPIRTTGRDASVVAGGFSFLHANSKEKISANAQKTLTLDARDTRSVGNRGRGQKKARIFMSQ